MIFEPVVLEGQHVRLETLYESHQDGLCRAISDGELWKILVTIVPHSNDIDQFFSNAKAAQERRESLAFDTIVKEGGDQVVGLTRFMNASRQTNASRSGSPFSA